ncbi:hypothetical protein BO85DRAFT_381955 [Aspergillus piperis CBS 112811]|uniref:Uncharacterized protein n=2 Tax=Aspergillus subgen. Circumdati TaxID=2720871 RepID=A0A8G1QSV3_9EURO|nr:hypothetical protein BO85DRAFT_381955 [Aspergillus piperis CBS 112811]OJZ86679.1 hypothetical protein ASPFODRAFT_60636 [Aspergillus luchuensis CBS 106.47]RAH53233.1 hypothetical protein BO85DRAFT_381955 [Aspergillus piperis CBS 112811]
MVWNLAGKRQIKRQMRGENSLARDEPHDATDDATGAYRDERPHDWSNFLGQTGRLMDGLESGSELSVAGATRTGWGDEWLQACNPSVRGATANENERRCGEWSRRSTNQR